ncbi:hypothetical protein OTU49_005135, partial [Cherax quadricarinatus]
ANQDVVRKLSYYINNLKRYEVNPLPTTITTIQPPVTELINNTAGDLREFILNNSEILKQLDNFLEVLPTDHKSQIKDLIFKYKTIFSDVPKPCTLGSHDIELLEDLIKQSLLLNKN